MNDRDTIDFEVCAVPLWTFFVVGEQISLSEVAEFFEVEPNKVLAEVGENGLIELEGYTLRRHSPSLCQQAVPEPSLAS